MKKIIIQFSVALLLITGIYVYKYNNEKDLEVSNISQDIMNDYEDIIIKHGNEDEKVIALTFDDGPDKDFTPQVLDILKKNNVPTFIFINKIDRVGAEVGRIINEIKTNFSNKICFIENGLEEELSEEVVEGISENDEELIEKYLNCEYSKDEWIRALRNQVKECRIYPVFSGSALQDIGIKEFIYALDNLTYTNYDSEGEFKGAVYKVKYDNDNKTRITFIKCTNGKFKVRDEIKYKDKKDKISSIRIYNGEKFKSVDSVEAGDIFGVTGVTELYPGEAIGYKKEKIEYDFIPIMVSKVIFNDDKNAKEVFNYFKI